MWERSMPMITAIITTFNREGFLRTAIQSVLQQTFRDFQLLILDNSSQDGTRQVVQGFTDERVRYLCHAPMGIGEQRNLGVQEAQSEFLAFLDDDDEWLPRKLEQQVAVFQRGGGELGLVYGGFTRMDAEGRDFSSYGRTIQGKALGDLLWFNIEFSGSASNPMMKTSVVRELGGYDTHIRTSEDWEMYLRLADRYLIDYVPEPVVRIRSHRGPRLGDRVDAARDVQELVLKRYGDRMTPQLKSLYLQAIGGKFCRVGSASEGRIWLRRAIQAYPLNWVACAQYVLSWVGPGVYARAHRLYKHFAQAGG